MSIFKLRVQRKELADEKMVLRASTIYEIAMDVINIKLLTLSSER